MKLQHALLLYFVFLLSLTGADAVRIDLEPQAAKVKQ